MTTYALPIGRFTDGATLQRAIGTQYHLGLSTTLPDTTQRFYGYLLEPDNSKSGGFQQSSDTTTRDALVNYASPNLIDRDLVFGKPRVTDGDFSGGGYQEVWIDPKRYFDSDLDPRIPGYLQLRAQWATVQKLALVAPAFSQTVAWNSDFWFTFGETNGNVYSAHGATTTVPVAARIIALDTDGSFLYAATSTTLYRSANGSAWTAVTSTINGTATMWWVINQGTNGYFAYYQSGTNLLYKIDLTTAFPIAAAAQPQVPVGGNAFNIVDLVEYQTSIAILTVDAIGAGTDVWYFDGTNLTRIIRIEGYTGKGICQALGSLYVSLAASQVGGSGGITGPVLAQVDSGTFTIVARPGSPFFAANQTCVQPRSSSQYVYWPIINPSVTGISTKTGVNSFGIVIQYDVLTGAVTHLPTFDGTEFDLLPNLLRQIAPLGDSVAIVYRHAAGDGVLQYQLPAFGTIKYQPSGWLASSHIDFATPSIEKRFRRIEVHHAPLNAGEAILIEAFVDTDPLAFTTSLTPVPSGATATNSTVGSSLTAMTFGADTIGKTLYYALKLTAGTGALTTPRVSYVSVEVGGTWSWVLNLACTSKQMLLDGQNEDTQGTKGKDLAYLLLLAYENGQNVVLYHRNGQQYQCAIDSFKMWNPSPILASAPQERRDEEYTVALTLRQVA